MSRPAAEIQDWLVQRISALTKTPAGDIDIHQPVRRFGLDSVTMLVLASDLEQWLGCRFQENPLEEHPTIEALAKYVADRRP